MDFLTGIENLLDMPAADKVEVMRELTSHYDDLCREMVASGIGAAQAQAEAECRMGTPSDIASRLNAAHNSASWRSALLCVVPFAASAMYMAASALHLASGVRYALLIAIGVTMLVASARELLRGRRPMWLATWLAAGLTCIPSLLHLLGGSLAGGRAYAVADLFLALSVLILGLATRRLLKAVVVASAIAAFSAAYLLLTMSQVPGLIEFEFMLISAIVPLVLLAILVFEAHTYRSGLQAVLFLLAIFVLRFGLPARASDAWAHVIAAGLCGLAVVWFTRAPQRGAKALACYFALFASVLVGHSVVTILPDLSAILSAACWAGIFHLIVISPLMPVMLEEVKRQRLTLAR